MHSCSKFFLALATCAPVLAAQSAPPYEIEGGYIWQSNAFNGLPGAQNALNAWDANIAFPSWHNLRFKIDYTQFVGTNSGASQKSFSLTGGGQYEHAIRREKIFGEALFGELGINKFWGPKGIPGETAAFVSILGGGLDTPISNHFAVRVQADYRHTYLDLALAPNNPTPYRVPGLPTNFATLSTGLVWTPRLGSPSVARTPNQRGPVKSELQFEALSSFGHFEIFANSKWGYLRLAGVEYDRNSWGTFIGARMDYVAEILPVTLFRQPTRADMWGFPTSSTFSTIYGIGISPIGLRMIWRDGRLWKPYYLIKPGLVVFNQKAIAQDAGYLNFSLQQSIGMQFRLNRRSEFRAGIEHFHFSDAFIVPSNPGIDEMSVSAAISLKLGKPPGE